MRREHALPYARACPGKGGHKKRPRVAASAYDAGPPAPSHSNAGSPDMSRIMHNMRAILSVSDKTGLVEFAPGLAARGVQLISTGGTAKALADAGLPVDERLRRDGVSRDDGRPGQDAPPGGPRRHTRPAPSRRRSRGHSRPGHRAYRSRRRQPLSVRKAAARIPETPFDELVEQIDIGGRRLLRAAAKNFRDVLVVVDPADYPRVLEELGGPADRRSRSASS